MYMFHMCLDCSSYDSRQHLYSVYEDPVEPVVWEPTETRNTKYLLKIFLNLLANQNIGKIVLIILIRFHSRI